MLGTTYHASSPGAGVALESYWTVRVLPCQTKAASAHTPVVPTNHVGKSTTRTIDMYGKLVLGRVVNATRAGWISRSVGIGAGRLLADGTQRRWTDVDNTRKRRPPNETG